VVDLLAVDVCSYGEIVATDAQVKQINALIKKYPDSCSICHQEYDEDYVTYTVFGYDKNQKMQVTTGCCARTLTELVLLGVCGCFDPDERDEIMENHPMAKKFFSN
jgi:hypothetical protein